MTDLSQLPLRLSAKRPRPLERRLSLPQQPIENIKADKRPIENDLVKWKGSEERSRSPPAATVARRAKSYSDFYDVARKYATPETTAREESGDWFPAQIGSEAQYIDWYDGIKAKLFEASNERYQEHLTFLRVSKSHLALLLNDADTSLEGLRSLTSSLREVDSETKDFRKQLEDVASEHKRLKTLSEEVTTNLQYYTYLEPMTKRLNAPGAGSIVKKPEFPEMLANLDECIKYMGAHSNHKEAAKYGSQYRALLTRALTLIRVHFTNALREIAADVSKRAVGRQMQELTLPSMFYAKFRVAASELKGIAYEIQKRALPQQNSDSEGDNEYLSLLNELYQSYSATRGRLVLPFVSKRMKELTSSSNNQKDTVSFARSAVGFIRGICLDEFDLWYEWFSTAGTVYDFLESICEPLYDQLRPRIIHETHLPKLCEFCSVIQSRYIGDEDDDSEDDETTKLDFASLIRPALEDAQSRLVYLALGILRNEIENYKPKPADLDDPAGRKRASVSGDKSILGLAKGRGKAALNTEKSIASPLSTGEKTIDDSSSSSWALVTSDEASSCYPTLRKAFWLLSSIYRLVNSTVFDDLAHQIVHQTTISIQKAASLISPRVSTLDSQLFLIKHLLILKQQIVAFDFEFVTPDVSAEYPGVSGTFYELRERGGLFNPANLVRLMSSGLFPRVVSNMIDAKTELDGCLRASINELIETVSKRMLVAIADGADVKKAATAEKAARTVREVVQRDVPFLTQKLEDYLTDTRTREILLAAVQYRLVQGYGDFYSKHSASAPSAVHGTSNKGKGRENEVWGPGVFSDWSYTVFNISRHPSPAEEPDLGGSVTSDSS